MFHLSVCGFLPKFSGTGKSQDPVGIQNFRRARTNFGHLSGSPHGPCHHCCQVAAVASLSDFILCWTKTW